MKLKRTLLAIAVLALTSTAIGFTVRTPTVMVNGVPVKLVDSPPPNWATTVAAGVFEMWPSTAFKQNSAAIMKPNFGFSTLRKTSNVGGSEQPTPTPNGGAFRIACASSHMGNFDPIVYPPSGSNSFPKKSHLHVFFGNSDVDATTPANLDLATYGRSSCVGGTANRSGYWVPAVIDTTTGFPVTPSANIVYYKNESAYRVAHITEVTVPPANLRIIAGDPTNLVIAPNSRYRWECPAGGPNGPTIPGVSCNNGQEVLLLVYFPQCWDGVNLDSANHQSHMAYENPSTGCPPSHPVMIPQISYNIHYKVSAQSRPENWRLSSDLYATSYAAGGLSAHGDWWNGWNQAVLTQMVVGCLHASLDCHAHRLGLDPNERLY